MSYVPSVEDLMNYLQTVNRNSTIHVKTLKASFPLSLIYILVLLFYCNGNVYHLGRSVFMLHCDAHIIKSDQETCLEIWH